MTFTTRWGLINVPYWREAGVVWILSRTDLYEDDRQDAVARRVHQAHVILDQRLSAAAREQVELFRVVVVAVVGAVVCQVVLQAGPRGGGVTAAERNAVQQVAAVHVTPDTTATRKHGGENKPSGFYFLFAPSVARCLVGMAIQCQPSPEY